MKRLLISIRKKLRDILNLDEDKADEEEIIASIRRNVSFKGPNLWTLIFAIFIASIGLNVNATAVIIGAMLISPLMGPIMGIGLGIGINDLDLVRSGLKNLFIAAFFSILTSTIYFWLTPLHDAQSEILARTTPSLWDVFIAFFGGLAGIVAGTRKEKSNVIPGVAIATALMPPLCTVGYGLGNGYYHYPLGAMYLFFINCVFICISTFLIVRFLKFHKKEFVNKSTEKRVSRTILIVVVLTVLPSIYLTAEIVARSIFESNARKFITSEFHFSRTQVINQSFTYNKGKQQIDLLLIGEELSPVTIDSVKSRMKLYGLDSTALVIRQGLNDKEEIDFSAIRASIMHEVFNQSDSLREQVGVTEFIPVTELRALYPDLRYFSIAPGRYIRADSAGTDTIMTAVISFRQAKSDSAIVRLRNWLQIRLQQDSVKLIVE